VAQTLFNQRADWLTAKERLKSDILLQAYTVETCDPCKNPISLARCKHLTKACI